MGMRAVSGYFLFWVGFFVFFRGLFLLYHHSLSIRLSAEQILGTFYHGLKMDVSFSSYLTMMALVLLFLSIILPSKLIEKALTVFTLLFLAVISIISVADLELFKEWGFRFDATPLLYLNTPSEMVASVSASPYLLLIAGIVLTFLGGFKLYGSLVRPLFSRLVPATWWQGMLYLLVAGAMIIPIRGGLQLAPMNQSVAFFSENDFANQAAINVPWNFFWSIGKQLYSRKNPYQYMAQSEAVELVDEFYRSGTKNPVSLLSVDKPNVIIILWESLTAKVVPALDGTYSGVVPEFDTLIKEGILFRNFYANGNRSDKGIIAVLSGYPAQPKRSIVKIPVKSSKLPVLTKEFNDQGYFTGYFHGGELAFANMKSYLVNADFNSLVGKDSFRKKDMNSKWGAHDHILLEKAFHDISTQTEPFFNVIFTLSSHEPFDIPVAPRFPGPDLESQYKSSLHYTDQSIGTFIREAKKAPWYPNTLIIIMADHGHRLLGDAPRYDKVRFHIPMLWLGGALSVTDTLITQTCSQTDLAKTLLSQLKMDSREFNWSRDIFNQSDSQGVFYIYNEGIGYLSDNKYLVYDHPSNQLLIKSEQVTTRDINLAKSHLQLSYQDYLNK